MINKLQKNIAFWCDMCYDMKNQAKHYGKGERYEEKTYCTGNNIDDDGNYGDACYGGY